MSEPERRVPDFAAMMQNEDYRNGFYNQVLAEMENVKTVTNAVKLVDTLNFDDLTPELWATVCLMVDPGLGILEKFTEMIKSSVVMMDSPTALAAVQEVIERGFDR